ncbi:hypothetical protein [Fimbriiglobus ruber]|uniref:Uncharacterized protein n=1 Tax=Fimbriiglobus ruber TaxID=1908690 RepID=A0A225DH46_9BACT|nr:hypothetical protein [Fimbriiglobus ruber]OWK36529.1 hypothetical protein FRUB_09092 [Fimbriiglobus ruber]
MQLLVRDAETKRPVAGVEVEGHLLKFMDLAPPKQPKGATDADGIATLWVCQERWLNVNTYYDGFVQADQPIQYNPKDFERLPKRGEPTAAGRIDHIVELKPHPSPTFVLIVPEGYRGMLRVRFEVDDNVAVARQRFYPVPVDKSGLAVVRYPKAICGQGGKRNILVRTVNGKRVPEGYTREAEEIGLRWVHNTEDTELYLIGTGPECEALKDRIYPKKPPDNERYFDPVFYDKLFEK